ncbi:tubulin-specific chaperone cofactor E-like protein isoform X1 [Octopus sinensis]|uniref:Tubulin-specific chaperone cofactor E-like protein isoform X1 n=1 Tax=Octopus sinensis TaxID=2607531 RepID=A0A6P7SQB1_9MOLL|nr:tubulin-specific chaperone cofactor E-like protein isoform X1 [Octopus sinensis]
METCVEISRQIASLESEKNNVYKKSFTDALREKYGSGDKDCNYIVDGVFINLVVGRSPSKNGSDAEFAHLRNVVLSQYEIDYAGIPIRGLSALCPNVIDLDLSSNLLSCWSEILPLIAQLPCLKFVNLSHNKINNHNHYIQNWRARLPNLENLVLNSTNVKWEDVVQLCGHLPALKDLHLCQNGYTVLDCTHLDKIQRVQSIWMNDNYINSWFEIWKLRYLPNLKSLVLSGNPVDELFYHFEQLEETSYSFETPEKQEVFSEASSPHETKLKSSSVRRKLLMDNSVSCGQYLGVFNDITEKCHSRSQNEEFTVISCKTWSDSDSLQDAEMKQDCEESQMESEPIDINYKNVIYSDSSNGSSKQEIEETLDASSCDSPRFNDSGCGSSISSSFIINEEDYLCDQKVLGRPFEKLHTLCLSKTSVSGWDQVAQLRKFPALKSVRLMDIPFLLDISSEERRKLYIASLPNISCLNGSEVTLTEKEKAERQFLRYYCEKIDKPVWFCELEAKHGKLKPLVDIDLGARYQRWANIIFIYNGLEIFSERLHVVQSVGKLRKHIAKCLSLSLNGFKMYHFPCSPEHGDSEMSELQELRLDSLPLSRFDILDQDEIHIHDNSFLCLSV